ncbi:MAG: VOC family protein, partial [Candidatus Heimdallarchaeota archaeon]|nr:VOC family protein [Candidatus Heimdallarchaeota archaeon]
NMIEYKEENKAYFIMSVTDLPKAKDFYQDIFGFEVLWDYKIGGLSKEVGWAELALPFHGARIGLNLLQEGKVQQGSAQLSFYVKDVNAAKKYVESKGAETKDVKDGYAGIDIARSKYGYDMFVMLDPFGNEILFVGDDVKG